jgi:hypothetical protein
MSAPPPEESGSTKSRELYGNRVAALGKGRPTAPGNFGQRVVTSPSSRASPEADENAAKSAAPSTPNSVSPSVLPSRRGSSAFADRPVGPLDVADASDKVPETSAQLPAEAQPESQPGSQDATSSEPPNSATRSTVSTRRRPLSVSNSSSTGPAVTVVTPVSSTPLKVTPSAEDAPAQSSLATPVAYEPPPAPAEFQAQERPPVVTPKSPVSSVQAHISVEKVPVKEVAVNADLRASRQDRPLQNGSGTPSVTQLPLSRTISSVDKSKGGPTSSKASDAPIPNNIKSNPAPPTSSISTSSTAPLSSTSATAPVISAGFDDSISMSPPPVTEPGRRSFTTVVHRGDGDNRPDSRHSTTSRSGTVTPRPSSSSFKPGTDGGVVRSKRNFKHLGTLTADPPPSPGLGEFGVGDLAALLQDAAWLEERLSGENMTLKVPSTLGEEGQNAEATKGGQATPAGAISTRAKGRGLTLGSAVSAPSSNASQSPVRLSPSTPSFQIYPDASSAPAKSSRGRKYFSLRNALRGQRLSISSEMSSDDSAPVATPPSPSFDLVMHQGPQGHGNDSMSIRSMFSSRSNKSGKSDSAPGSLRLSPRRGVARASSFAERFLNRASKAKSMLDDRGELSSSLLCYGRADPPFTFPDNAIPEGLPTLPPIISEAPGSLLSISPISASSKNETPFDRDIFDAFPNVPSEIPQRPGSYLFPVPPKTAPAEQDFRRSTIGVSTSQQNGSHGTPGWLRTRQES